MAKQSQIRWKQGDYIKLGRAVSEFNKKVKRLEQEQGSLGLPELIDYQSLKSDILTRKELNRQLELLRGFKEQGVEEIVQLNNDFITLWEKQNIEKEQKRIIRSLNKQIKSLESEPSFGTGSNSIKTLKARVNAIKNFDRGLISKLSKRDLSMKRAITYQNNVKEQLEGLPDEFENIKKHLLSIKNPITFYEEMQKSQTLQNFFDWYKNPTSFGNFSDDEDIANYIESELEI